VAPAIFGAGGVEEGWSGAGRSHLRCFRRPCVLGVRFRPLLLTRQCAEIRALPIRFDQQAVGTGECPKPAIEPFDDFFSRVTGPLCLVSDRLHHRQAKAAAFFPTAGAR
jgi:hypothetical protein